MPPVDDPAGRIPATGAFKGNHSSHLPASATINNNGSYCLPCHNTASYTTSHMTGQINLQANINSSPYPTVGGRYMITGAAVTFKNQTSNPVLGTCATVNCHFEAVTPQWGSADFSATNSCQSCHSASTDSTSHAKHFLYYSTNTGRTDACTKCHPNYASPLSFQHATSAGNRGIKVQVSGGSYAGANTSYLPSQSLSRTFGSCSSTYCHSSGQGDNAKKVAGTLYRTQKWGGTPLDCGGCHNNMATFANASSGSHVRHAQTAGAGYTCDVCHGASYGNATVPRSSGSTHVNSKIDLAFTGTRGIDISYSKYSANGFTPGKGYYGTCGSSTGTSNCHGTGRPTWGATSAAPVNGFPYSANQCEKCHSSLTTTITQAAFYGTAIPKVTLNTNAQVGAHFNHLSTNTKRVSNSAHCNDCHTIPASVNATGHLDKAGSIVTYNSGSFANTGGIQATYSSSVNRCGTTYCHGGTLASNKTATGATLTALKLHPQWDTPILSGTVDTAPSADDCGRCHGFPPQSGGHTSYATKPLTTTTASNCNTCHPVFNANAVITTAGLGLHINGKLDGGVSSGGSACYGCHTAFNAMNSSTTYYHHVLDDATPDQAPNTGAYPTSTTALACVSCHTDHNYFNASKASNLRSNISSAGSVVAASDYSSTSPGGICISCHNTQLTKAAATLRNNTFATTVAVAVPFTEYSGSAHEYGVTSSYGTSNFSANCSKCHTDEQTKDKQTSTNKFGTHYSATASLLNRMGDGSSDLDSKVCFRCHSLITDNVSGTKKSANNFDWFGGQAMSARSQDTFNSFSTATRVYNHNVNLYPGLHKPSITDETLAYISTNKHVSCNDCHDPHAARFGLHSTAGATRTTQATTLAKVLRGATGTVPTYGAGNWTAGTRSYAALAPATKEYQICFKCHSGANTNVTAWGNNTTSGPQSWTDIGLEFSPNNASYHPVVAAIGNSSRLNAAYLSNGWKPGDMMTCSDCHATDSTASKGPHGSSVKWMLTGVNKAWPYTTAAGNGSSATTGFYTIATAGGNSTNANGLFCKNCHPVTGTNTWHSSTDVTGGQHGGSQVVASCVGCHIRVPHGGKVTRLRTTQNVPARYKGNGSSFANVWVSVPPPGTAFSQTAFTCTSQHTSGTGTQESW